MVVLPACVSVFLCTHVYMCVGTRAVPTEFRGGHAPGLELPMAVSSHVGAGTKPR